MAQACGIGLEGGIKGALPESVAYTGHYRMGRSHVLSRLTLTAAGAVTGKPKRDCGP